MERIDHPTAASGLFTEGNPATSTPATTVTAKYLNDVQEEICNVIEDAGITLDGDSQVQLKAAIASMISTAVSGIEGGGGGGSGKGFAKITEATLGSDASTTNTSNTSVLTVTHTPIAQAGEKLICGLVDWGVKDAAGPQAKGYLVLQGSSDNSSWSDLQTLTKHLNTINGDLVVKTDEAVLGSDNITNSTSNVATGLQLNYTAVGAANKRLVEVNIKHKTVDSNGGGTQAIVVLQYYDGSNWIDLEDLTNQVSAGGSSSVGTTGTLNWKTIHTDNNATPQYRVVHRATTGNSSEFYADSKITVTELQPLAINENRNFSYFEVRDVVTRATAYYRLMHRVESGDTSTVYATNTKLRVKEIAV